MAFNPRYNSKRNLHVSRHPPQHNSFIEIFAAPPPPVRTLHEEEIVAARRKKMRSLLDIDLNAPHQGGDAPATAIATASGSAPAPAAKEINSGGVVQKGLEEGRERKRRRRRWEALLDAAAIAVIREYERNIGMEDMEFQAENRIRNPRKFGGGGGDFENSWTRGDRRRGIGGAWGFEVEAVATAAAPPHRSKRGRALALPNKYKDSVIGGAEVVAMEDEEEDEEFSRRRKSPAGVVDADRKPRRVYRHQQW